MKTKLEWIDIYNDWFKDEIKKHGKVLSSKIEAWLVKNMIDAKVFYYNTDVPIMDDPTYDRFEDHLKMLNPHNPFLEKVGTDDNERDKEIPSENLSILDKEEVE